MWHELTEENLSNAIDRAYEEGAKVAQARPGLISVSCSSGMHPSGHLVEIERRAGGALWGRCSVGVGMGCPAEMSLRPCWHLAAAAPLFLALEGRAADPDAAVEHAVLFDGPMPRQSGPKRIVCEPGVFERCARLQDTVNAARRALGMREIAYVPAEQV